MTEERERRSTQTRLQAISRGGYVIVVTQAFGPNGEDLMDYDGEPFSGEPGVKVRVTQGDIVDDVVLSPYYGDPSKRFTKKFVEGVPCQLTVPSSGAPLNKLPIDMDIDGGAYCAIYLTKKLEGGELVAINNVWGNYESRMMDENEIIRLYAESEGDE